MEERNEWKPVYSCVVVEFDTPRHAMESERLFNLKVTDGWELFDITTYPPDPSGKIFERYTFRNRPGFMPKPHPGPVAQDS